MLIHTSKPQPDRPSDATPSLMSMAWRWRLRYNKVAVSVMAQFAVGIVVFTSMDMAWADQPQATCQTCHADRASELSSSIHNSLKCQQCHGGETSYMVDDKMLDRFVNRGELPLSYDHGTTFRGKPNRADVPTLCGSCHADVQRMNAYGLRTDQLARYWTSGHGKTLREKGDDRVAVCIDCHGSHNILAGRDPQARTYPTNVPSLCGSCHADHALMDDFDLPVEVVDEYMKSVHGKLLLEQGDTGAPTCVTCHDHHGAVPPGFANVGSVCGQCHKHVSAMFATSIHAQQEDHKGCVQCHGGGEDRHFHLIERINQQPGILIQRYQHLMRSKPGATPEQITESIHPNPKAIINQALATCMECHEDIEEDDSLPKLFGLLDKIAKAERYYVKTADRLDRMSQGVLLVESQRFKFEEAKTHLIELAPIQHTLNNDKVQAKVEQLSEVCDTVNQELDDLESGLDERYAMLVPVWIFAILFSIALYAKYKQLKRDWVKPLPD